MITAADHDFGRSARNRFEDTAAQGVDGALAALETFYYAFNRRDLALLGAVWFHHDLTQLDHPLGGLVRSSAAIVDCYRRSFATGMDVQVTLTDTAVYHFGAAVGFAGRERGAYRRNDGRRVPLDVRTSHLFAWDDSRGRWAQLHHHGSIDDPFELADYQASARS